MTTRTTNTPPTFFARLLSRSATPEGPKNEPSSYPPAQHAYVGVPPDRLVRAHGDKFGAIHADFAQFYPQWPELRGGIDRLLLNVAAHVQQLPASRNHHHREEGGLFAHILEVALIALNRRQEYNPRFGLYGSATFLAEVAWPLSVLIAAMLHDIAKPAYSMRVFAESRGTGIDRRKAWNPYTQSLYKFMTDRGTDRVYVDWLDERGNGDHDMFAAIWLLRLVPEELMHILHAAPERFLFWLQRFLTDRPDPLGKKNILGEVVRWADHRSSREDVTANNISYRWGLSDSVSHIFRTFAAQSAWNQDKAMFWLGKLENDPNQLAPLWILTAENCIAFKKFAEPFFPPNIGLGYDRVEIAQHLVAGGVAFNAKGIDLDNDKLAMPSAKCRVVFGDLDHVFPHVLFLYPAQVFADIPPAKVARIGIIKGDMPDGFFPPTLEASIDGKVVEQPLLPAERTPTVPAPSPVGATETNDTKAALSDPASARDRGAPAPSSSTPANGSGLSVSAEEGLASTSTLPERANGKSPSKVADDNTEKVGADARITPSSGKPESTSEVDGTNVQHTATSVSVDETDDEERPIIEIDAEDLNDSDGDEAGDGDEVDEADGTPVDATVIDVASDEDGPDDGGSAVDDLDARTVTGSSAEAVDPGDPFAPIGRSSVPAAPPPPTSSAPATTGAPEERIDKIAGGSSAELLRKWRFLGLWSDEHDPDALTHLVIAFLLESAYRQAAGAVPERLWGGLWRQKLEDDPKFPHKRMVPLKVISDGHRAFHAIMGRLDPHYQGFVEDCWPTPDPRSLIGCQKTEAGAFVLGPNAFPRSAEPSVKLSQAGITEIRRFLPYLHTSHRAPE